MTGFVYAIECGDAVKIGYARDPVRRLSELNVGSANTHRLLGYAVGTKQHERELHQLCFPHRIRGEWFRKEGVVNLFLDRIPLPRPIAVKPPRGANSRSGPVSLSTYMAARGLDDIAMGRLIGVSVGAVRKWRSGHRIPRPQIMRRIFTVTQGIVSFEDFVRA